MDLFFCPIALTKMRWVCDTDYENSCYSAHNRVTNRVTYVTALSLNEKLSNKDPRDLTTTWRNTANHELQGVVDNLVTRTFTQRGCIVDRHKWCHGSRLLSVGARIRQSKCYERSRYKLNEKIDGLSKSPKNTFGSLFWQLIYTKELFLHLLKWKCDTYA